MDKPISVGDLVMVVRGHECVVARKGGIPFRVLAIVPQRAGGWHCANCGEYNVGANELYGARAPFHTHPESGIPLGWLKRIPPQEELEGERRDEKLTEPA